jgi:hypothetical protein
MVNEKRKLEISSKILELGRALLDEGNSIEDYGIAQSGTIMILLSGILLSDEDTFLFSEICAMFSAKKILESDSGINENDAIKKLMKVRKINKNKPPKDYDKPEE